MQIQFSYAFHLSEDILLFEIQFFFNFFFIWNPVYVYLPLALGENSADNRLVIFFSYIFPRK